MYYWVDENCAYALSGQIDRAQMLAIGRLVYGQLAAADAASVQGSSRAGVGSARGRASRPSIAP